MKWKLLLGIAVLFIFSTAIGAQDASLPTITGSATDEGIEFPSEVPAGYVNITLENNRSETPASMIIGRLNEGVTMDDLMGAMSEDEMAAITLVTLYGGQDIASGESISFTTEFIPGDYIVIEPEGEGFTTFTVTGGDTEEMTEPESDVHLAMIDFGFGVPAFMPAGPQVWHLDNIGDQWHEVVIFEAPEGVTSVADVRAALQTEGPEPEQAFFWAPMGADIDAWVTIDLEPGTYVLLCFLPDLESDFSPHFMHGMVQLFTVE